MFVMNRLMRRASEERSCCFGERGSEAGGTSCFHAQALRLPDVRLSHESVSIRLLFSLGSGVRFDVI